MNSIQLEKILEIPVNEEVSETPVQLSAIELEMIAGGHATVNTI